MLRLKLKRRNFTIIYINVAKNVYCCRALARQHTNLYTWCAYDVTAEFIAATISIYVILSSTDGPKLAVLILFFCSRGGCSQHGDYYKRQKYNHKMMRIAIKFRVIFVKMNG